MQAKENDKSSWAIGGMTMIGVCWAHICSNFTYNDGSMRYDRCWVRPCNKFILIKKII